MDFQALSGAAHFANPNSSAEAYILHRMQQNDHLQSYCGAIGGRGGAPKRSEKKFSEWGLPGVENVATSLESLFMLSRAPQRPYIKKSENFEN